MALVTLVALVAPVALVALVALGHNFISVPLDITCYLLFHDPTFYT